MKRHKWLRLREGARWPRGSAGRDLRRRLNAVGREVGQVVTITSGLRTAEQQWFAYQDYLRGGNLAAPCCSRHYIHSWSSCLRQCASNHCRSRAADTVIADPTRGTINIGESQAARKAMRRHGLCLPVGSGEVWHVEVGNVWRS